MEYIKVKFKDLDKAIDALESANIDFETIDIDDELDEKAKSIVAEMSVSEIFNEISDTVEPDDVLELLSKLKIYNYEKRVQKEVFKYIFNTISEDVVLYKIKELYSY